MASVPTPATTKQDDSPVKKAPQKRAKPIAKKKAIKSAKPKQSSTSRVNDDAKITALKKPSDIQAAEGTFCYYQILACLQSKTVGEAKEKLLKMKDCPTPKRRLEVAWVESKGYIRTN